MKRFVTLASLLCLFALSTQADDLVKLEGKWSVKKSNSEGQSYTQVLEIKKDKFKFTLVGADAQIRLYADGTIKLEKLGPFNVVKFTNIKAGASESDTQPIDDDRTSIYMLGDEGWTVASNFDRDRDNQKPSADTYTKAAK